MSTPEARLKIWREEQEAKTAEGRRRIWEREQSRRRLGPRLTAAERREQEQRYRQLQPSPAIAPPGTLEDIKIGAERGYRKYLDPALAGAGEAIEGLTVGDPRPALRMAEEAVRGTVEALRFPQQGQPIRDPQTGTIMGFTPAPSRDTRITELQRQREARYQASPQGQYSRERIEELNRRAALDPSLRGKVTRGTVEVLTGAAPTLGVALATRGALLPTGIAAAVQSAGQPAQIGPNVAAGLLPIPGAKLVTNAIRRRWGRGAAQVIEAEAAPAGAQARAPVVEQPPPPVIGEAIPSPVAPAVPAVDPLQSVFSKLGTDNIDQIGAMIANANRRLGKKRTPKQIQSSIEDYNALKQLTPDEHDALSRALPARTFSPVAEFEQGGYSREIRSIPMSERSAQLDANLRELEQFFGGQSRAPRIAAETGPPALSADMSISGATPSVRAASAGVTGPRAGADLDALNVAVENAAKSTTRAQRFKDELLGLLFSVPKSLRSTADVSYPLRQGAILLLRPLQWRQSRKVWKEMFRGFKTKNFEAIKDAIDTHPLRGRMDAAGLYRGTQAGEEAFARRAGSRISEAVRKAPVVKQSEQAYTAAADTQRAQAFEQYARLIDKAGLSPEEALKADKAAAQWINIATGRGSLGQTLDRAMEGLNFFYFSPRYVASRLNVFNPVMYARNASSPGGRVVLKQQMSDLMQFASVAATTLYLAQQAGADVTLNPKSSDFGKIRLGRWRWDMGAGLSQVMRMIYRVGADIGRAGRGEKPKFGESAIDIGETFLSYKLSPPMAVFRDFIKQRTPEGRPFTAGRAVADLTVPMQWADFVDAWVQEGMGGAAMTLPGAVGIGAQLYEPNPINDAIEKTRPLFSELQRLDKRVDALHRRENEPDAIFNARVQQFGQNYSRFGLQLVGSPRFRAASDDLKNRALNQLNGRAKSITLREIAFPELELDAELLMDAAENAVERETERKRQRGF